VLCQPGALPEKSKLEQAYLLELTSCRFIPIAIKFIVINSMALPVWRSGEKNLKLEQPYFLEPASCRFALYFIQTGLTH